MVYFVEGIQLVIFCDESVGDILSNVFHAKLINVKENNCELIYCSKI